jgi:hypothetical protein
MTTTLEWAYDAQHTLTSPSGVVTLEIRRVVRTINLTVAVVSGDVSDITLQRSLNNGVTYGPVRPVVIASPPLASGGAIDIDLIDESPTHIRLKFGVGADTELRIVGRGVQ